MSENTIRLLRKVGKAKVTVLQNSLGGSRRLPEEAHSTIPLSTTLRESAEIHQTSRLSLLLEPHL